VLAGKSAWFIDTINLVGIASLHHRNIDRGLYMLTLPELLEDKRYKEFFTTVPKVVVRPGQLPWRLMIQQHADGPWAKKEFPRYADAFRLLARRLRDNTVHDGAICSRGIAFAPPQRIVRITKGGKPVMARTSRGELVQKTAVSIWEPRLPLGEETHIWCTYCRRPTVFRWFRTHHLIKGTELQGLTDVSDKRCTICGARESFIRSTAGSARKPGFDPRAVVNVRRNSR
jgi:hypothetical protein